jgi:large subunit ribosomal protein L21
MENKDLMSSYAIFDFGGKQYQAVIGKTLALEKFEALPGDAVSFERVLLVRKDVNTVIVGKPYVNGGLINAEVVSQNKGPKLVVFRFKKRKRIHTKNGHRQPQTIVRFKSINA